MPREIVFLIIVLDRRIVFSNSIPGIEKSFVISAYLSYRLC
jgi:hypothetical protein